VCLLLCWCHRAGCKCHSASAVPAQSRAATQPANRPCRYCFLVHECCIAKITAFSRPRFTTVARYRSDACRAPGCASLIQLYRHSDTRRRNPCPACLWPKCAAVFLTVTSCRKTACPPPSCTRGAAAWAWVCRPGACGCRNGWTPTRCNNDNKPVPTGCNWPSRPSMPCLTAW